MSDWSDGLVTGPGPSSGGGSGGGANAGTMSNVGLGMQAAGVIGQTIGAYKKADGAQQAYEFQSQIARNNAAIADMQAKDAILRGEERKMNIRRKAALDKGRAVASLAARGLDLGEGSPLDILASMNDEREALLAADESSTNKEVWGRNVEASNYRSNVELLHRRARQESPGSDAFSTLLSGATKVAASWYPNRAAN